MPAKRVFEEQIAALDALCEQPQEVRLSGLRKAIALTRQDAAMTFLLNVVRGQSMDAEPALEALLLSSPSEDLVQALQAAVSDNLRLAKLVRERSSDLRR